MQARSLNDDLDAISDIVESPAVTVSEQDARSQQANSTHKHAQACITDPLTLERARRKGELLGLGAEEVYREFTDRDMSKAQMSAIGELGEELFTEVANAPRSVRIGALLFVFALPFVPVAFRMWGGVGKGKKKVADNGTK